MCYDTRAMPATCPRCGQSEVGQWCPRCGADVEQYRAELAAKAATERWPPPAPPPTRSLGPALLAARPAGFWIRAAAVAIDSAVLLLGRAALSLVAWLVFGAAAGTRPVRAALDLVTAAGIAAYWLLMHWMSGQTVGKRVVGVRVVSLDGGPLTLGGALLRLFGYWLSSLVFGIGYLMAAFRRDKRALHDLLAGTRVEHVDAGKTPPGAYPPP